MPEPFPIEFADGTATGCRASRVPGHGDVAVVVIEAGERPVPVIDMGFLGRLEVTLKVLPPNASGMVLWSSTERAFVAGADLASIQSMDDSSLQAYLAYGSRVFSLITRLSMPTASAIGGACLGGGFELAAHCDGLIGSPARAREDGTVRSYAVGLPEAGLGICPGWGGTQLLAARIDPELAIRRTASGEPFVFEEACEAGLFDEVSGDPDELLATACRWVSGRRAPVRDATPLRWIGRASAGLDRRARVLEALDACRAELLATESGVAVCAAVEAGLSHGWKNGLETEREALVRLRHTPEAASRIEAFLSRSRRAASR